MLGYLLRLLSFGLWLFFQWRKNLYKLDYDYTTF